MADKPFNSSSSTSSLFCSSSSSSIEEGLPPSGDHLVINEWKYPSVEEKLLLGIAEDNYDIRYIILAIRNWGTADTDIANASTTIIKTQNANTVAFSTNINSTQYSREVIENDYILYTLTATDPCTIVVDTGANLLAPSKTTSIETTADTSSLMTTNEVARTVVYAKSELITGARLDGVSDTSSSSIEENQIFTKIKIHMAANSSVKKTTSGSFETTTITVKKGFETNIRIGTHGKTKVITEYIELEEKSSSSSSSFGDAVDLFYFTDKNGDLYILRADAARAHSSLVFKAFSPISAPPCGLAMTQFIIFESSSSSDTSESSSSSSSVSSNESSSSSPSSPSSRSVIISSSSSTSESSVSRSSLSSTGKETTFFSNVYILRKKDSRVANLSIYNIKGFLNESIDFSSGDIFLGMCIWPDNNNLLVAITQNTIHMLYISNGQIGNYSFDSPIELNYGITPKDIIDENSAEFFVRRKSPKEIVLVRINKKDRTCTVGTQYFSKIPKWNRLGGMVCDFGLYGLIGEMDTIYNVVEENKGYSHIYKTLILEGETDLSLAYTMPFTVYGCVIPPNIWTDEVSTSGKIVHVSGKLSYSTPLSISPTKSLPPTLTFRRYSIDGNFIENFNSLFLGNMKPGVKSAITVINVLAEGLTSMSNLKIGITENGIIGSNVNDVVMYGVSETIDPLFVPTKYFSGVNADGTSENINNIEVGTISTGKEIISQYIYLMIDVPEKYIGRGYLGFKWFFEYE